MKQIFESSFSGGLRRFEGVAEEYMLPVRDGVKLFTRVLRKKEITQGPVILIRNPYWLPQDVLPAVLDSEAADWVEAGYIYVEQQCRGTARSEGICIPYQHEREDGLDLLDWIRKQSFYQGEIYLFGSSYLSSVHFSWLDTDQKDIKGAVLAVQDYNRYNILYRNGFYKCGLHGCWAVGMYRRNQEITRNYTIDSFRILPLDNFSKAVFNEESTFMQEDFRHPWPEDPFWSTAEGGMHYLHALDHLNIPILFITAFYDIYTDGILQMWDALSPELRAKSALVITPYEHNHSGKDSLLSFPHGALNEVWPHYCQNWCNAIRENKRPFFVTPGQTTYYAQYEGKWITVPRLENGENRLVFYLGKSLFPEKECSEPWAYTYLPWNPASFKGGCCLNFGGQQPQDPPNSRFDIRSLLTKPFTEDVRLRGKGSLRLTVSSDCEDTCFYARLSHVRKDGSCYCLRDDIVSLRRQNPDYHPGEKAEVVLSFTANAILIGKGEQLRLDLSSSCWPYFMPHRNTTENMWECVSPKIAHNTIYLSECELNLYASSGDIPLQ